MSRMIIFSLTIMILFLLALKISHALFQSQAVNLNNTFTTATVFPSLSVSPTPHIVINEVFVEGGNNSEWVELYNPQSNPVNVGGWKIIDNSNQDSLALNSVIPANGYGVIVASESTISIASPAVRIEVTSGGIGNNITEHGRVVLKDSFDQVVDYVSFGSDSTYFTLPPITDTNSLSRQPNGADTNLADDWVIDSTPSMGVSN